MPKIMIRALAAAVAIAAAPAMADTVSWTQWGAFTQGANAGSASGTAGGVGVSYTGELQNLFFNYPSWGPNGTFNGGSISNAPPAAGGIIQLFGGRRGVNTLTFSSAVVDPVLAIWSLGQGGINASFTFNTSAFTVEAGGPSAEYGGSSIVKLGNVISGVEGNGTIRFSGTYTSISWTNPVFENWYGFTAGIIGSAVPEPATWGLLIVGFGAVGASLRRRRAIAA